MAEKMFVFTVLIIGLMVFFNIAGLTTTTGIVLGQFGITRDPASIVNLQSSGFYVKLAAAITLLAGFTAVVIGTLSRGTNVTAIYGGLASGVLILFTGDLITIILIANADGSWVGYLIGAIMTPILFGYLLSVLDWIRGHD